MNTVEKSSISPAIATARFFARKPFPSGSIKVKLCPLCNSPRGKKDFLGGNTRWVGCPDCKSFYAESFPSFEEAQDFYKADYRELESHGDYPTAAHKRTHVIRVARQLALVMNVLQPGLVSLDYGCALGWALSVMKFLEMDAYGVEMGEFDRAWSKEHLGHTLYERIEDVPVDRFDIITLSHVLEHFIDPIAHMRMMYEYMNPGGRVIIEVPNWEAPSAWSAFHAVIFNTRTLDHALQEAGFVVELVRSKDTDRQYPPNLIWAVARKPNEETDADEYTEIRNPSRTIQPFEQSDLYISLQEGGCDMSGHDEVSDADGAHNPPSEDTACS